MKYLYIKYNYGRINDKYNDDIREVTSYIFANTKKELNLKAEVGDSPYATWIDDIDSNIYGEYIKFSVYVNMNNFNQKNIIWLDNMIKECLRDYNLNKIIY